MEREWICISINNWDCDGPYKSTKEVQTIIKKSRITENEISWSEAYSNVIDVE